MRYLMSKNLEFMVHFRNLSGENLDGLGVKDLQHLENLLQVGISRTQARKVFNHQRPIFILKFTFLPEEFFFL